MKAYKYASAEQTVVHVIDADGISRMSMLAQEVPDGAAILPADPPPADVLARTLRAALTVEYESRMRVIYAACPPSERESWPVQISEARALLADEEAATTPWIDAAAAERGIDRLELAERIVGKDDAYRVIHGALTGARQRIEDAIDAAGEDPAALAAIDVTAGWPAV